MPYNLFLFCFTAELFVNGEIVQRSPERQRRVEPVPQRASDRPRYNDRTRYARRRENQRWSDDQKPNNKAWVAWGLTSIYWMEQSKNCLFTVDSIHIWVLSLVLLFFVLVIPTSLDVSHSVITGKLEGTWLGMHCCCWTLQPCAHL